jgi:putative N-acetylmannosamine-6-phosphate epimerase
MTNIENIVSPQPIPGLIWRVVDDNMVVISPATGDVHVFSQTGADIWRLLVDKKAVSEIESYLVEKYIVSTEQAHTDVRVFIQELTEIGLVR